MTTAMYWLSRDHNQESFHCSPAIVNSLNLAGYHWGTCGDDDDDDNDDDDDDDDDDGESWCS